MHQPSMQEALLRLAPWLERALTNPPPLEPAGDPAEGSDAGEAPPVTGAEVNDLLAALAVALELAPQQPPQQDTQKFSPPATHPALAAVASTVLRAMLQPRVAATLPGGAADLSLFEAVGRALLSRLKQVESPASPPEKFLQSAAWHWLDALRRRPMPELVAAAKAQERLFALAVELMDASRFTFAALFWQRAQSLGPRTLFRVPSRGEQGRYTWQEVAQLVERTSRGLLALLDETGGNTVAILSENRFEAAVVDLACLCSGIVNVLIPANATAADVQFIMAQSGARVVVASTAQQLRKLAPVAEHKRIVVLLEEGAAAAHGLSFGQLIGRGRHIAPERLDARRRALCTVDEATVMYTSGTTGPPKGIRFSHRNIVSKRFARGLALPAIGEQDLFLCYLPFYHTFGRFLEMCGCIYWGATYVFAEDATIEHLVRLFGELSPTVFISIPKKWMELYEQVAQRLDLDHASDSERLAVVRQVVGARLRFGLSAAGYLPTEVFRFFQENGVELLSGFGMTEATGGILMNPPGGYRDGSLGVPLPGIEVQLAADGELLVRGPYVMLGYTGDDAPGVDAEGFVHTGDLLERDAEGYYYFVDRKKEIYKNLKGETIAPQRIENLFRDFDSVHQAFLVGDHCDYNTLLIMPHWDTADVPLRHMSSAEVRDHFRDLIFSVNRFLSPPERILDFALLERELSLQAGELTPKGTFRRSVVVQNHAALIAPMYRKGRLHFAGMRAALRIPHWVLQAGNLTTEDIQVAGNRLIMGTKGRNVTLEAIAAEGTGEIVRIGTFAYRVRGVSIDLGILLTTPELWLGNEELAHLVEMSSGLRTRRKHSATHITRLQRVLAPPASAPLEAALDAALAAPTPSLEQIHTATLALFTQEPSSWTRAMALLSRALGTNDGPIVETALVALRAAHAAPHPTARKLALQCLLPVEEDHQVASTLDAFLRAPGVLLDEQSAAELGPRALSDVKMAALLSRMQAACCDLAADAPSLGPWIRFALAYGSQHPASFRLLRGVLSHMALLAPRPHEQQAARAAIDTLQQHLRTWLGPPRDVAIDPESQTEYGWEDVLVCEPAHRAALLSALRRAPVLSEAIFLLHHGALVHLSDIARQGVQVSAIGQGHGKTVYHVRVQTRFLGAFDLVINLIDAAPTAAAAHPELEEETRWLMVAGAEHGDEALAERFGGYWPQHALWTEEYVPGDNVAALLRRLAPEPHRLHELWPFLVWSAAWAHVAFWESTHRRIWLKEPSLASVIAPPHDYLWDTRLVSIAPRQYFYNNLDEMLLALWHGLVERPQAEFPQLNGVATWDLILAAFLEVVGAAKGLAMLRAAGRQNAALAPHVEPFVQRVEQRGLTPRQLHFAVQRFHRWAHLAQGAERTAVADNLREIYDTYHLAALRAKYPAIRVRFFRDTVFRHASEPLASGLDELIELLSSQPMEPEEFVDCVAGLRAGLAAGSDEEYFLARLTYPHLKPHDVAVFGYTGFGGTRQGDLVVSMPDASGLPFSVRHPVNPREIARLQKLFVEARLPVVFYPEHSFLLALSDRGEVMGGLVYEADTSRRRVHLGKIVVAPRFRGRGIGEALMRELINRATEQGMQLLTAGYFRPEFMHRFGFTVDHRYAGQVLQLGAA